MAEKNSSILSPEYLNFKNEITARIRSAQYEALKAVNKEMIALYWEVGKRITEQQTALGWGKSVVENLSRDIQKEFPGIKGFGVRNMWDMARFYAEYQSNEILQPLVAEISWSKHIVILTKCKEAQQRQFYILATKKYGWTKDVLINKIEAKTYENYLLGQSNFDITLPDSIKNQAILALKDEYTFDLVGLAEEHSEYELEQAIIKNIRAFLMEFGTDFSFIGNQYRLEVDGKEYFIDLLLYNRRLQAMIAIELKIGEFQPEYKGKMEFYLNILNDTVKLPHENPAIGIIICKSKSRMIVEYALKSSNMPIGVATYSLSSELPEAYKKLLPTSEEIAKKIELLIER
ncbi:PDDEXK nuclease domain-containing protein [Bacteroides pyogenes]|uniref:PDDEXK nuclease domain-containing protein n=1 Tax=Bacteroides pyogenes TaxID=310300 RepID=UPI0011E449DD|nr:PDDEXK nuclease domain-containing protein [Bacteroides pyogenes]MBR8709935.1 putative nuclease YhcG [Bacteroides pyogenes]MBR8718836.1 putative nuclease YhcG [Bacteroides pyogenes]MBR8748309.1 putative nuclease YhcG [Bacteroides pyogenes]MBR8758579.1 putative nuclease YhcG [Bacteroides pyogenes]MBR8781808.1 putative nuclease YhcG [Bacteroides pyogenes]